MNLISFDMMLDGSNFGPIIAVRTLSGGRKDLLPSSFCFSSRLVEFAESRLIQFCKVHPIYLG